MKQLSQTLRRTESAFTLIEVVLAAAVASIGIIAIIGLLPNAIQSSRNATDNTLSATIAQDTFTLLRTNAFHSAILCDTCTITQDLGKYDTTIGNPLYPLVTNFYDQAGFDTASTNAYYAVILSFQPQTPLALTYVTAMIVWPAQAAFPINTNIFVSTISQYDR